MIKSLVNRINDAPATIPELSVLTGVSVATIHNWRHGKSNPKDRDLKAMERVLEQITSFTRQQVKELVEKKKSSEAYKLQKRLRDATGSDEIWVDDLGEELEHIELKNKQLDKNKIVNELPTNKGSDVNYIPSFTKPEDESMMRHKDQMIERMYNGLLQAHRELISKIKSVTIDDEPQEAHKHTKARQRAGEHSK